MTLENFYLYVIGRWNVPFLLGHAGAIIAGGKGDAGAKVCRTGLVLKINLNYTPSTVIYLYIYIYIYIYIR